MNEIERKAFAEEVKQGLGAKQKRLSSKWFYDEKGDGLFVQIMNMPEYYLTDCEFEILSTQTSELVRSFGMPKEFDLYELGAGDGTKTIELLKALTDADFIYHPIDISEHAVDKLTQRIALELPKVSVKGLKGEYFQVLRSLSNDRPKVILFMGSNIGNLPDELAKDFLSKLSATMQSGDKLMLGIDLKKDKSIILPAYNDAQGFTAEFNLNLLDRINKELEGDFDRNHFVHKPQYDEKLGIAKSYIESTRQQEVIIKYLDQRFEFDSGEKIFTEISRKYDEATLLDITQDTGLTRVGEFYDIKKYFSDVVFEKR